MKLEKPVLTTIKMTDYTALVTISKDGSPHLVAGWNCLPVGPDTLLLAGERYVTTRKNLERDPRFWLLVASRELNSGFRLSGRAKYSKQPDDVELIKKYWPRCHFALRMTVETVEDLVFWPTPSDSPA